MARATIALSARAILPSTCSSSISAPTTFLPVIIDGSKVVICKFAFVLRCTMVFR